MLQHRDARLAIRRRNPAANFLDQPLQRFGRQRADRLVDGRQRRPERRRGGAVVEANHRQVARHVQMPPMRDRDDRGRHVVVAGEDRGRRVFAAQQVLARRKARGIAVIALDDPRIQPAFLLDRTAKARQALDTRRLAGIAVDEADAAMAQADQVAGHVIGGTGIVDPDGHGIGRDAADDRHGQTRLADDIPHEVGLAQRRCQYDARDPLRDQPLDRLARGRTALFTLEQEQLRRTGRGFLEHANQQLAHKGRAGVGIDDPDADLARRDQAARHQIGRVVQSFDDLADMHPHFVAHARIAVDDARDGHGRDAGLLGDVDDGHAARALSDLGQGHPVPSSGFTLCRCSATAVPRQAASGQWERHMPNRPKDRM